MAPLHIEASRAISRHLQRNSSLLTTSSAAASSAALQYHQTQHTRRKFSNRTATRTTNSISSSLATQSTVHSRQQQKQRAYSEQIPFVHQQLGYHHYQHNRHLSTTSRNLKEDPTQTPPPGQTPPPKPELETQIRPSKIYTFEDMQSLTTSTSTSTSTTPPTTNQNSETIIIDVREPSEIHGTGRIPGSKNIPISSAPDSFFLPAEEFEDRFGFEKPSSPQSVVFYCKAGVRSKAAARLAGQAGWDVVEIGEFPGSWVEWFDRGGRVERD